MRSLSGMPLIMHWTRSFDISFDGLMKTFTLVTDCATTLPCLIGASASSKKKPFGHNWMGCISHQLNTAMKHSLDAKVLLQTSSLEPIVRALDDMKVIIRIFKKSNLNQEMGDSNRLIQEVDTRFGTTFDVVQRFLEVSCKAMDIIQESANNELRKAADQLNVSVDEVGNLTFHALEAIYVAFRYVRVMQTEMEKGPSPTLDKLLPNLLFCMLGLEKAEDGELLMSKPDKMVQKRSADNKRLSSFPHPILRAFCGVFLRQLRKIEVHPLWIAGAMLHPNMRSLSFVTSAADKVAYRAIGCRLIRSLMEMTNARTKSKKTNEDTQTSKISSGSRDEGFSLTSMFDKKEDPGMQRDELDHYHIDDIHMDQSYSVEGDIGVAKWWIDNRGKYPELFEIAMRVLATPASSCSSERNFSCVNNIVTSKRTCLRPKGVDDLVFLRSALKEAPENVQALQTIT